MFKPGAVLGGIQEAPTSKPEAKFRLGQDLSLTQIPHRSFMLTRPADELIKQTGVSAKVQGFINIEAEGNEPLLDYLLSNGQLVSEVFLPGTLCLGLADQTGNIVAGFPN